jgi:cytochrome c553
LNRPGRTLPIRERRFGAARRGFRREFMCRARAGSHTLSGALLVGLILAVGADARSPSVPPALDWAYPRAAPGPLPDVPPGTYHVPGGTRSYTAQQLNDDARPPDWNPEQHPPPPDVVLHGHAGGPTPCASCHLVGGQGFLGIPDLAGLEATYIVDQVQAFRSGARRSSEPGRFATRQMIDVASRISAADLAAAASYFASLPRRQWVRVVETATVPATRPDHYGWLDRVPGGATVPIGGRIVELAEDWDRMLLSDPGSGVVAYVPSGAVARGEALVRTGGAGGQPCASCHGASLAGSDAAPPLSGRSPAYLARMLWDIKSGARRGPALAPMQAPAAGLVPAQIIDVVAYLAAQAP